MSADTSVTLVLPARPEYLLLARLALTGLARRSEADEEALADVRLAVTEAAANACKHAYVDGVGDVTITFVLGDDGRLEVVVEDDGIGFERDGVADWRPDELGEEGMGLAIIRAVADEVEISPRASGLGTRLCFTRSLRG
ncbi:ATP-binding protein [Gaiella sp.]|uniref:ATP-binding protein n=1 Tax=Gaiella sp. TaxID=2663207 RepID=UPI003264FBEA